jgi:acetylglutamate kinase
MPRAAAPTVLKVGGELLDARGGVRTLAAAIASLAGPLVVVHGGGREIDEELAARGIPKRTVDGLRITDGPTLEIAVGVLAGRINTRLVAALAAAAVPAVGLTGADAGVGRANAAPPYAAADGSQVDLGFVGVPIADRQGTLLRALVAGGWLPVVASLGATADGQILNVNADTMAVHVAIAVGAARLLLAGITPGVLDANNQTIPLLDAAAADALIRSGQARAGMVVKLRAALDAVAGGVDEVALFDGRQSLEPPPAASTRNVSRVPELKADS